MTTQIINANPQALRGITVERSSGLSAALATLGVGDVVRFGVRNNTPGNQGLIQLNGQLVKATLPETVKTGSKILAQITEVGNQVLLKILDAQAPLSISPPTIITSLSTQLLSYANQTNAASIQTLPLITIPENLASNQLGQNILSNLFAQLATNNQLTNSQSVLSQLLTLTDGNLSLNLKDTAASLQSLLEQGTTQKPSSLLITLDAELRTLLTGEQDSHYLTRHTKQIINVLLKELPDIKKAEQHTHKTLVNVLKDLQNARVDHENFNSHVQSALTHLEESLGQQVRAARTPNTFIPAQVQQAAHGLEQLANSQETLNQLNPLMQALGEPALILFPFLFQGLISHGEMTISPDSQNNQEKKHAPKDNSNSEEKSSSTEPYHKIHITVPLPSLGETEVDIAYRSKEIMIRFTVREAETSDFLQEQLEHLAGILRNLGLEKAELIASVGEKVDSHPTWSKGLLDRSTIVA